MIKRLILLSIVLLGFGGYFYFSESSKDPCPFCNKEILDRQAFYEDDLVLALYTHKPIFPGHCLIIPKRHVERFEKLTDDEILRIGQVIKKVHAAVSTLYDTSSYLVYQKNGVEVGQSVPHLHFHYVPRKLGDNSGFSFILKMFWINVQKPITSIEMQENVDKLKEIMIMSY